jgi:hypothetical protein
MKRHGILSFDIIFWKFVDILYFMKDKVLMSPQKLEFYIKQLIGWCEDGIGPDSCLPVFDLKLNACVATQESCFTKGILIWL